MAKFNMVGFEQVEKMLLNQSKKANTAAPKMLAAGAEVLVAAQKQQIEDFDLVDKAAMKESITATKPKIKDGSHIVEVYPSGKDDKGVRNATKGFIAEYGKSNEPPRPWLSTANEKSYKEVHDAMRQAWEGEE